MSPFHSLPVDTEWATYPTASGGVSFPFWPFAFHVRFQVLTAVKVAMLFPCAVMPCSRRLILTFRRNRDGRLSPSSPLETDKSVPPPETFVFTYESTRLHSAEQQHCLLPLLFEIRWLIVNILSYTYVWLDCFPFISYHLPQPNSVVITYYGF
jgi:hypothetical protein